MKDSSISASGEEESATVGAEVTSLGTTPVLTTPTEDNVITEDKEELKVGTEIGKIT